MTILDMSNDKIYSEAKESADEIYKTLEEQTSEERKRYIIEEYKRIKHDAIIESIESDKEAREYIEINKDNT